MQSFQTTSTHGTVNVAKTDLVTINFLFHQPCFTGLALLDAMNRVCFRLTLLFASDFRVPRYGVDDERVRDGHRLPA